MDELTVISVNHTLPSIAQTCGIVGKDIEHRLNIRRRTGDHAENLARCRLLLQRFGEFTVSGLNLFEQAHILNGDRCLIGSNVTIAGGVVLGENCYVGSGTSIMHAISVGAGALVGIGSNVIRDVAPATRVAGNPARTLQPKDTNRTDRSWTSTAQAF